MADIGIAVGQTGNAPQRYVLTGAQEVVLHALRASYNGSGAASSYFPAVQIISPGGIVVATFTTPNALAAGASADVTWFQGVTAPASASSAAAFPSVVVSGINSQVVGAFSTANVIFDTIIEDTSSGVMWTAAQPTLFVAPATGMYLMVATVQWGSADPALVSVGLEGSTTVVTGAEFGFSPSQPSSPGGPGLNEAIGAAFIAQTGTAWVVFNNNDAVAATIAAAQCWFVRVA